MRGKHAKRAAIRKEQALADQLRRDRLAAAEVADAMEKVRSREESVAEFAQDLMRRMSSRETADAEAVKLLGEETEALLLEAAALERATQSADLCFKRWYAVFNDELDRAGAQNVRPRYIPSSSNAALVSIEALEVLDDWSAVQVQPWMRRFRDRRQAELHARGHFGAECEWMPEQAVSVVDAQTEEA